MKCYALNIWLSTCLLRTDKLSQVSRETEIKSTTLIRQLSSSRTPVTDKTIIAGSCETKLALSAKSSEKRADPGLICGEMGEILVY